MSLSVGRRLGPYEIKGPLGVGGMGEVYRAVDSRLGREVAVKVIPVSLRDDPDRVRRFELEARAETGNIDIQIHDLAGTTTSRFTFDPATEFDPIWSPDGTRILFSAIRENRPNLFEKVSSGGGDERRLLNSDLACFPCCWSRDGRWLVYGVSDPRTQFDLWALPAEGGDPYPVLQTDFDERSGQLSPDGRWLAYISNESGRYEVYVRAFPSGAANLDRRRGTAPMAV